MIAIIKNLIYLYDEHHSVSICVVLVCLKGMTSAKNQPHLFHIPVMGTGFTIDTAA